MTTPASQPTERDQDVDNEPHARVLVVSDDAVLGSLIARSLGRRGVVATPVDLALARSDHFAPAVAPELVIVDLEATERVDPRELRRLAARAWMAPARVLLAADRPAAVAAALGRDAVAVLRPADVAEIVASARAVLAGAGAA